MNCIDLKIRKWGNCEMKSLLESTKNTRPLLKNSLKLIRSDVPSNLSEREIQWLLDNKITTIIDLRQEDEIREKRCVLEKNSKFAYYNLPVRGGSEIPDSPNDVPKSYINMVDEVMWKIIELVENATTNVLYFCNAGKDRTGVVSAILLLRMNIDKKEIIDDYFKSGIYLEKMLKEYVEMNPSVDLEVITPKEIYMETFLEMLER
ncbi:MAG: tyrosine-protein phosphatase [Vagococcus sp.]|uniref:tyrosine-protein phosphatase n=2 Tax=Vagococcus sp. TaxID=1933889 RepID=UPI002FC90B8F